MALYIIFNNNKDKCVHFNNMPRFSALEISEINYIQADCDELSYIRYNFHNIPTTPKKRVVKYYGDIAKFIIANWE